MSSARRSRGKASSSSKSSPSTSLSSSKQASQPGLLETVQQRLVKDVFEAAAEADPGWKILVVDNAAMKIISAAVGMYDIMERKITLVESLQKVRAPFKDMGAIYVVAPTEESIGRVIADFEDKSKLLYGQSVFIYTLGPIPGYLIQQMKGCRQLIKRLKALSEINVDFLVKEQRAYIFDTGTPFNDYFQRGMSSSVEDVLAGKLVTVCATLNEYPYIRYKQTSGICSSVAKKFKAKMDQYVGSNPSWWYHGSGKSANKSSERERSTFLLLDRSSDCLTPLMHDFTYQAMVHDLLTMEGDKITYQAETAEDPNATEDKDVLLNEKDKLWVEMRGKHIAKVIEVLSARIQEVCNSSTSNAFSGGSGDSSMSLSQLASALKELPEYREVMSKLSQHMHISHSCMDVFNKAGLFDLSDIEQTLATGKDEDGGSPKLPEMINRTEGALIKMREEKDRLRLILVATISQNGLSSADRDRLLRAGQLSRESLQILDSISKLGIQTLNNIGSAGSGGGGFFGVGGPKLKSSNSFDEDSEYASSRYVPMLKPILNELVSDQLSLEEYPSVVPMPSSKSMSSSASSARRRAKGVEGSARRKKGATDKWSRTGNSRSSGSAGANYAGGRNLVFMVGGLSYQELKVCRDVMEKESREIVVGSTKFVSPAEFLDDLATLSG